MSAIIKNIPAQSVSPQVVLGINTGKKATASNNIYKNYVVTTSKKWYRQPSEKRIIMDWDSNKNELEFE